MEKLKMQTPNRTLENIERIAQLFPNVVTEVEDIATKDTKVHEKKKIKKAIDFDLLRQQLSDVLVEDDNERYRLDWPGKKASLLKATTPVNNNHTADIILDFFSGSATTAHAVMQLNAEEIAEELATKETDPETFRDLSCISWQKKEFHET